MQDLITKEEAIKAAISGVDLWDGAFHSAKRAIYIENEINALPPKEIDYQMCADAMMKMWIEKVVTDAEYNKIMDRLNEYGERVIKNEK